MYMWYAIQHQLHPTTVSNRPLIAILDSQPLLISITMDNIFFKHTYLTIKSFFNLGSLRIYILPLHTQNSCKGNFLHFILVRLIQHCLVIQVPVIAYIIWWIILNLPLLPQIAQCFHHVLSPLLHLYIPSNEVCIGGISDNWRQWQERMWLETLQMCLRQLWIWMWLGLYLFVKTFHVTWIFLWNSKCWLFPESLGCEKCSAHF